MLAFLALMQNQKKEIVFSVVLSFIDGFFIMIPFIIAFKIVNAVPLFNPAASGTLDVRTMYRYIGIMAAAVLSELYCVTLRSISAAGQVIRQCAASAKT